MTITEAQLNERTYGCELEYEGISQEDAAKVVAKVTGGTYRYEGWHLRNWAVIQPDGRKWNIVSDGSLCGTSAEVVTPILHWTDIQDLMKVVRALREAGAKVSDRTGFHIHVGAEDFTPANIKNYVKTFYKEEELILKAAGTKPARIAHYTQKTNHGFVERICSLRNPTMESLAEAYYHDFSDRHSHYSQARYFAANLHNLWNGGKHTIELRFFNGTKNALKVKAYVQLAILLAIRAKNAKAASARNQRAAGGQDEKYALRCFLLRLGAIGPVFKTMRTILLKNMKGSAAWRDGRHD